MLRSILAAATAAVAALILGAGPALAAGSWTVVPVPPGGGEITGISAPTGTDAWAVGDVGTAAFIDHWNGTAWSPTTVPTFPCTGDRCYVHLFSVSASATTAWALGAYSPKPGYQSFFTLSWNGSAWIAGGNIGTAVDAVSPTLGYAVDEYAVDQWTGTGWSGMPTPPNPPFLVEGDLTTISATSATNVWAVGTYDPAYSSEAYDNYSVHWNGSAWTEVAMPLPNNSSDPLLDYQINSIDAISPTNVWAVGDSGDNVADFYSSGGGGTPANTLIEHYNGTSWSIVPSPATGANASLTGVTSTSASNVTAVGSDTPAGATGRQSLIENWNGSAWTTVSSPAVGTSDVLNSVSTSPGAAIIWAAGSSSTGSLLLQNG